MPPQAKFTREQIVSAAMEIVIESGTDALTARSLGDRLKSSARPIFTVFESMDEVKREVVSSAEKIYGEYVERGLKEELAFKGVGKAYISFAADYPKLFRLLFMSERNTVPDVSAVLPVIERHYGEIMGSITGAYGVDNDTAERLYKHLWIYSHGISVLTATKVCNFSAEQISEMLTEVFKSLLINVKMEKAK